MIRKLVIENFYSIKDELTLDFKVAKNVPENDSFLTTERGERYPKVVGVFGHNASGKTTVAKALSFLRHFILFSHGKNKSEDIPVSPFAFSDEYLGKETNFTLEFMAWGEIYEYQLSLTSESVKSEKLRRLHKTQTIFSRENNKVTSTDKDLKKISGLVSSTSSAISFIWHNDLKVESLNNVINGFANSVSNVGTLGRNNITLSLMDMVQEVTSKYLEQPELLGQAVQLLSNYDLGLTAIRLEEVELVENNAVVRKKVPFVYHEVNGVEKRLFIAQESNGTQSLYVLVMELLYVLKNGGLALVDEIDAYLHPHMLKEILDLFYDEEFNIHGSQLIFTGHADYILNYLEKDQILFTEKSEDCVTDAYFLKEVKGVRRDDNIREKYHAGAYGGIPQAVELI